MVLFALRVLQTFTLPQIDLMLSILSQFLTNPLVRVLRLLVFLGMVFAYSYQLVTLCTHIDHNFEVSENGAVLKGVVSKPQLAWLVPLMVTTFPEPNLPLQQHIYMGWQTSSDVSFELFRAAKRLVARAPPQVG
jgi:hypothetical protein